MMLEDPLLRVIPIVAIPMVVSMLVDSLYNLADTYFVSQIGTSAVAAVGINDALLYFVRSISLGFGVGTSSYLSRLLGARDDRQACRVAVTALLTSTAVLTVFALAASCFLYPLVFLLGATESSAGYAAAYTRYILLSAPFTAGEVCLSHILRAEGSTKYSMFGMVSGCVINVLLDPILIRSLGLGVSGAAIATTISKIISFLILLRPFLTGKTILQLSLADFSPSKKVYAEIARVGIPTFLRTSMLSISGIIMNKVAGGFSDHALAAVAVANKCTRFVSSAVLGFCQGYQPIVGYCWGAKNYRRVREAFWTCCGIGAVIAVVIGAVIVVFSRNIIAVFATDPSSAIVDIGSLMLRSQCYTMAFHIWVLILNALFQALGRGIPAAVLGLCRQGICLIPCCILLSRAFGITGLSLSQAAADLVSFLIAIPFLFHILAQLSELIAGRASAAGQ